MSYFQSHPINTDILKELIDVLHKEKKENDHFNMTYCGENTQFIRFNQAKVRQIGSVRDGDLYIQLIRGKTELRQLSSSFTLTGDKEIDIANTKANFAEIQSKIDPLPIDPFVELPQAGESSQEKKSGSIISPEESPSQILKDIQGVDLAGLYTAGSQFRASGNSEGQFHWFETENFIFDYSLYTKNQKAVKGMLSDQKWDQDKFKNEILRAKGQLEALEKPEKKVAKGKYRTYLAPAAVDEILPMFGWNCFGEASIRQGNSPLIQVREGRKSFSPLFNMSEDFRPGAVPRFNSKGEIAPEVLPLVDGGKLANTLVSSRSAKEYGVESNFASSGESPRSLVIYGGNLEQDKILAELGEGLYLSNLHYINWSDNLNGRLTGMTRYACFWVEGGEIKAPIENLRFDDSIFNLFGTELEAFTKDSSVFPDNGSYGFRDLGYNRCPGALLKRMEFTL